LSSSELKKILHELCQIVRPYRIADELIRGRVPTSAGENPHLPTPKVENHPDSPSIFEAGVGSLEAPRKTEETKK